MKNIRSILSFAVHYKGYAWLNILFNVFFVIFNLLSLLLFIPFLRLIFTDEQILYDQPIWTGFDGIGKYLEEYYYFLMSDYIQANGKIGALAFICVSIGVTFFFKLLSRYLAMFFLANIRNGVVADLRNALYAKLVRLPLAYFSEERKGDMISRATNDIQEVEFSVMNSMQLVFREPIAIVLNLTVMFYMSTNLTLFALILLPISALLIGRVGKSLKRTSAQGQKKMGEVVSYLEESLGGLRIIKSFNAADRVSKTFAEHNDEHRRIMLKAYRKRDLASPLNEFLGSMVLISLVWFGGNLILDADPGEGMSGEEFMGYIIVFSQLLRPVQAVASGVAQVNKGMAALERVNAVLDVQDTLPEQPNAKTVTSLNKAIEFRNVSFAYHKEKVLKNINLTVTKGKTIALVGESGGGKSTMVDLLPRFYDCTEGDILFDGVDIRDIKLADLRAQFGIVSQESILFNDTIYNNIAFGFPDATPERVEEAARIANAHSFISELEEGYQTNIGDRGNKLSGGQKQRISIARAVLRDPDVLILDEATSALDTESEKLVQEALENLMKNRTSFVIAHRLSTIRNADEIIVLQKGEIAERGTHQQLLDKGGVYARLSSLQSFQ